MEENSELFYEQLLENKLQESNQNYYNSYIAIKSRRESDYSTISNQDGTFDTHGFTHMQQILKKLGQFLDCDGIKELNELDFSDDKKDNSVI